MRRGVQEVPQGRLALGVGERRRCVCPGATCRYALYPRRGTGTEGGWGYGKRMGLPGSPRVAGAVLPPEWLRRALVKQATEVAMHTGAHDALLSLGA